MRCPVLGWFLIMHMTHVTSNIMVLLFSEFNDAVQERQKIGPLSGHGFRRNEYGSSPPTRGETSNYPRGIHGRWDNRFTGRNDKEGDSQLDRDSGKH